MSEAEVAPRRTRAQLGEAARESDLRAWALMRQGLTHAQIGARLGVSAERVRYRLDRERRRRAGEGIAGPEAGAR